MSRVTLKEDIHVSEQNFSSFRNLKDNFKTVLAEVERERPDFAFDRFNYIFGKLFCLCGYLFFLTLGRGQRDTIPSDEVRPLDLEFDKMPEKLSLLDKIKLMTVSLTMATSVAFYSSLSGFGSLLSVLAFVPVFILFYFVSFMFLVNSRREAHMADRIEDSLENGDVLAYLGAAHSRGVKRRLSMRGIEVEVDFNSRFWHYFGQLFSIIMNFTSRPLYSVIKIMK